MDSHISAPSTMDTTMSAVPETATPTKAGFVEAVPLVQSPPTKKRKHDDVMKSLDQAMGPAADDIGEVRPPKRQQTSRSIYSTLAKYGIGSKDSVASKKSEKKSDSLSKAPHLSAILARTAAKTRKALPFKLPSFSASSSSTASSTSIKDFSPSSAQAFLERLGTFKPSTYTSKPESIDSAAAARCGWTNDGKDRLACSICSASWVVAGREGMNRDAAVALVEKQRGQLVSQHKNLCPWRDRQCDASIYTVQIKAPAVMARELKGRSLALEPLLEDVVIQHPLTSSHISAVQTVLKSIALNPPPVPQFPAVEGAPPSPSPALKDIPLMEPTETAVVVALFGWSPAPPAAPVDRSRISSSSRVGSIRGSPSLSSLPSTRESTPVPSAPSTPNRRGAGAGAGAGPSTPIRRPSFTLGRPSFASSFASPRSTMSELAKKAENTMLHCVLCQRRVGMWTFVPPTPVPASSSSDPTLGMAMDFDTPTSTPVQSPARPIRPRPARAFDVLKEHRPYCPYVVRTTTLPSLPALPGSSLPGQPNQPRPSFASMTSITGLDKVEGWRAVLSSICRYGLGQKRSVSGRVVGPGSQQKEQGESSDQTEEEKIESMIDRVKSRGGKDLFKYVKGLLG